MRPRQFAFWCVLLLCAAPLLAADPLSREAIEQRLTATARYLASDELEGRGVATAGIDKAADYLAQQFTEMGLDTKRYQGTPFHTFHLGTRYGLGALNTLAVTAPGKPATPLVVGTDFTPLSLSGSGKFDLPVAFVGYGITAPKYQYDDYAGIEVRGQAVIVLRNEPRKADPASPFEGAQQTDYSHISHKVSNAIEHGAAAVLLVTDSASLGTAGEAAAKVDPLIDFQVKSTAGNRQIPVLHCQRAAVESLIQAVRQTDLATIEKDLDGDLQPRSFLLTGGRVTGDVSVVRKGKPLKNVVAVLPGQGATAEETIVLGAHYDHLGLGGMGSLAFTTKKEVHNGADDNGSGTSVLVEAARQLAIKHRQKPLPRRLVFIAFTAEESGLIGSERYVKDPLYPLPQTIAMLNLDMVGRLRDERLTVYGTGTAAEFDPLIDRLGTQHAFAIIKKPGGFGPSDHSSFYQRGIPVLHFFTGLHKQYHRPEDDADLLNINGMARISQMVVATIEELANASLRPTPKKVSGGDDIDGLVEAMLGTDPSTGATQKPVKKPGTGAPYLGIFSKSQGNAGYRVDRVTPGGPAEAAGVRNGDTILKLGDTAVQGNADVTTALKSLKAGQQIKVQLQRGGIDLEVDLTVGSR